MTQPNLRQEWTPRFVEIHYIGYMLRKAREAATASNDPVRQVGCVLALSYNEAVRAYQSPDVAPIMGVGCNVVDENVAIADKNESAVHAEFAAVADFRSVFRQEHDTLCAYVTRMPCLQCADKLREAGVKTIYFDAADERDSKWYKSFVSAARMLVNEGIAMIAVIDSEHQGFATWPIQSPAELTVMFSEFGAMFNMLTDGVTVEPVGDAASK